MITLSLKKRYFAPVVFVDFVSHGTITGVLDSLQNLYSAQKYYKKEYRHSGRELGLFYARESSLFKVSSVLRLIEKECEK